MFFYVAISLVLLIGLAVALSTVLLIIDGTLKAHGYKGWMPERIPNTRR